MAGGGLSTEVAEHDRVAVAGRRGRAAAVRFTRAAAVSRFVRFLDDLGAPTDRLLERSGLARSTLGHGDAPVPLLSVQRFFEKAARAEGIDNLGLLVGLETTAFDLGSFGGILARSITVYDYLRTGIRLIDAFTSGERFRLCPEGGRLRLHQWVPGEGRPGHAHADLFTIAVTMTTLREFLGPGWEPPELALHAIHTKSLPTLAPLQGSNLKTGCSHTSMVLPIHVLEAPIARQRNPAPPCDAPVPELPREFVPSVHRVAESLLAVGDCRIERAADAAGLSVRTLQRRLSESGMTYRGIVNAVRIELGSRWLASTEQPILEIALSLGYEDASNFTRAFRLRTGTSPHDYRRTCRARATPP